MVSDKLEHEESPVSMREYELSTDNTKIFLSGLREERNNMVINNVQAVSRLLIAT